MGQYGNQPDFGTIVTSLETIGTETLFPPSAIYIGQTEDNAPVSIVVLPVGNAPTDLITITAVQPGTFLPIIVVRIDSTPGVSKQNVLLYR